MRQYGARSTKQLTTVSVTPTSAPRANTTSRSVRSRYTWTTGSKATATWATASTPSGLRSRGAVRPSDAPAPVSSSQLPSTIPRTSSLPENAPRSSRISTICVMKAETPRQQTARKRIVRPERVDRTASTG